MRILRQQESLPGSTDLRMAYYNEPMPEFETGHGAGSSPGDRRSDPVAEEIGRAAERVCALILYSDLPLIDIQIAAADVRRLCQRHYPDRGYLYQGLYASRFRRLWEQWRGEERWR